ncbi:MAG: ATP-binding protein [Thermodesulforhabdaceae bacterium]
MVKKLPKIEDLVGIEYSKLGFFREAQERIHQLRTFAEELERRQRQIEAILEAITDLMAVLDLNGKIVSVNHVYYKIFGNESPVGKYCYQVFRNSESPCPNCPANKARETNQVFRQEDVVILNGKRRYFEITASPLRSSSGFPCHILLIKRDVTTEREYSRKCYEAEKMATIGLLASGVAHEINNPLAAIYGFSQGLKRRLASYKNLMPEPLSKDIESVMDIIIEECGRCQEIIKSLLTYSRESPADFAEVNLNTLIKESVSLLKHRISYKQRIVFELSEEIRPIRGNPQQLKQVILNLVLNAIDATSDEGGIIKIKTSSDQDTIEMEISDNGCGIPEEYIDKIFDPFFTTKPVGKGTGMGLTVCYNILQNHGAHIRVKSQKGIGSVFTVVFKSSNSG